MSVLGYITIILASVALYFLIKKKGLPLKFQFLLSVALYFQLFFLLGDRPLFQLMLLVGLLVFYIGLNRYPLKRIGISIMLLFVLVSSLAAELFNGVNTFENKEDYYKIRAEVDTHFRLWPYKLYREDGGVFIFSLQSKSSKEVWGLQFKNLYRTEIKLEDGRVYYFKTKNNKLGQLPDAKWFEFGEKESWGGA